MNKNLIPARLILRINRFVATVLIDNTETEVYVPNTGRLSELAIPGADCLLTESHGKYNYKLLYIISNGFPVMIDSTLSNSLFAELLIAKEVPGFEKCTLIKREPVYGNHRFDYLVSDGSDSFYIELKSCTLFFRDVASFPDAVSSRASEHIRALSSAPESRLVILILNDSASVFVPNFHTDYEFYSALKENGDKINISALRINYSKQLEIETLTPVPVLIPEISRSGYLLVVLADEINKFYIYMSPYMIDAFDEIRKIKNGRSILHIFSGLNCSTRVLKDFPILDEPSSADKSIELFYIMEGVELKETGNDGHRLFRFSKNPLDQKWFHDHILELRFLKYSLVRPAGK